MRHQINRLNALTDALVGDVARHFGENVVKSVEKKLGRPLAELFRETLVCESAFPRSQYNYDTTFMLAHMHETACLNRLSYSVAFNGQNGEFKTTIQETGGVEISATRDSLAEAVLHAHRTRNLIKADSQGIFDEV